MTLLESEFAGQWVGFLQELFPLVPAGFLVGCAVWLVSYVVSALFRAMRGRP